MGEKAYDPKMIAEIDLMKNNVCYVVKNGELIEHELPEYGKVLIKMHAGAAEIETTTKRKV